jgi:catechol 2,3-dioxygenase-like lactoylglutathione lyase family enzyme
VALAVGAALGVSRARAESPAASVRALDSVGFTVADMDASLRFFTEVLDFTRASDVELAGEGFERLHGVFGARARVVRLRLGRETLELTEYLAPRGRSFPEGLRGNDRSFQHVAIIVSDMARAYARLRQHGVRHASTGPQRLPDWNPHAGGIEAFYFRDPDGHFLELLAFPPGKGDPRWQAKDRLFLGLDHTAIVVADTQASLRLWRDQLGLAVAGESENWGPEQERLNNVFGARLRITGLRAPEGGPGVEFLEYLAPRDGRPAPADLKANDLLHWQTTFTAAGLLDAARRLFAARALFVSPGEVAVPEAAPAFTHGLMLRDPDGHAVRLISTGRP